MSVRYAAVSALLCSALVATSGLLAEEIGLGITYAVVMALVSLILVVGPAFEQGYLAQLALAESRTDSLTGIGNRRAVVSRLYEEVSRCSRGSDPLAILMIDVDKSSRRSMTPTVTMPVTKPCAELPVSCEPRLGSPTWFDGRRR